MLERSSTLINGNKIKDLMVEITDNEILGIAIRIERQGALFYKTLAGQLANAKSRTFLLGMASEESMHEKNLEKMLRDKGPTKYGWEKEKAVLDLIENHFQTDIFPNLDEVLTQAPKLEDIEKAFDFAIEAEKVSAEFYSLLGEFCNNFEAKTLLLMMEKAERDHLVQIETLKRRFLFI